MRLVEMGTGYTPIPAKMGAATEIVAEELTKAWMKAKKDVLLLDLQTDKRTANDLPIIEVPTPKIFARTDVQLGLMHKLKRVVYSLSLGEKLKHLLKNEKEEVILHFHNQYNLYFFLKRMGKKIPPNVKIAYTVHSYIWPGEWENIKDTIKKKYFQEVYCVRNADYVLVLNDKTAEHFVKHLNVKAENIHKVSNGVNTEVYSLLTEDELEAFQEEKNLKEKKMIFQAGSICDRKNQLGAVHMLADYLGENRDVVYMYAGGIIDREYKEAIDRYAREKGIENQVIYVGELAPGKELNQYYNGAHVTLFPSKVESFGLVVIESLAAGTPVLLLEKPLFELEKGYYLFGGKTEEETKKQFLMYLDFLLGREKDRSVREEVVQKYSWEAVQKQHFNIFTR